MDQQVNDLESSTSSAPSAEAPSEATVKMVKVPKVVLNRLDEQTLLNFLTRTPKKSQKRNTKVSDKVKKVLKPSPKKTNDTDVKRSRGRPKKINVDANKVGLKKNNLKLGVKNKTSPLKQSVFKKSNLNVRVRNKTKTLNKNTTKDDGKLQSKPGMLKKTMLQKRSKVSIPQAKKTKVSPSKVKKPQAPAEVKPTPPKPKLEVIQSKLGDNSSDSSGDEFLYDELIEELENTANKRVFESKPVQEKTTITLKPNAGNKPPTVLKGGIVKKTDLPSNLNLFTPSTTKAPNVIANGLQKKKPSQVLTPSGKRKSSGIFFQPGPAKKASPWPVSLLPSPKKSPSTNLNNNKKKDLTTNVGVSQLNVKPTAIDSPKPTFSPPTPSEALLENSYQSVTLGMSKPKMGPKQTAKVVPLSKSFDADEYLSDEYLEEESLECDEVVLLPKESKTKPIHVKPKTPATGQTTDQGADFDLLKILTDDPEEPARIKPNESVENSVKYKPEIKSIREENASMQEPTETYLDATSELTEDVEPEEAPVRTIYDVMNEFNVKSPSWNLHIIPETSAFCIAQVTKGRLGLPTLKKCIELDPVTFNAKVYIHQYHIKRFDAVYESEESILALIQEIDSIKA